MHLLASFGAVARLFRRPRNLDRQVLPAPARRQPSFSGGWPYR